VDTSPLTAFPVFAHLDLFRAVSGHQRRADRVAGIGGTRSGYLQDGIEGTKIGGSFRLKRLARGNHERGQAR
jgi:hypothetical protein